MLHYLACHGYWQCFYYSITSVLVDPFFLPKVFLDAGAIRHVLGGADIMTPGIVKSKIEADFEEGQCVSIFAEGMENAMCIGKSLLSSGQIKKETRGKAIVNLHYLGDPLWRLPVK